MKFLSVCSGIEAASVAWIPLGFDALAFSEIDKFPCAVLAHHYPEVTNLGDMLNFKEWPDYDPDILVGGTPCQSFSVTGLRKGLADPRGNLMLTYLAIADRYKPKWIVWENVPGVLSSWSGADETGALHEGQDEWEDTETSDLSCFYAGLAELGYQFVSRVLDAQFFGVPQRRRRVFVVGHLGDWRRAAAVLFERHSLQRHPAPSREKREGVAPTISTRTKGGSGLGTDFDCDGGLVHASLNGISEYGADKPTIRSCGGDCGGGSETLIAHSLRAEGFDASEDGTGRGTPLVPVAFSIMPMNSGKDYKARETDVAQPVMAGGPVGGNQGGDYIAHSIAFSSKDHAADAGDMSPTLRAMGHSGSHANAGGQVAVAFAQNTRDEVREMDVVGALAAEPGMKQTSYIRNHMQVRRLTPRECERLQGFPDDYTLIPFTHGKPAADGPRYKALGNSMAVPVMRWIGERIQLMDWLYADD